MNKLFPIILFLTISLPAQALKIPCYLQSVTESTAVICWEWDKPIACDFVYGKTRQYDDTLSVSSAKRNEIVLNHLEPGIRYYYNIRIQNNPVLPAEELYFFTSPATKEIFQFAVIGDTRGGRESFDMDHKHVIESILQHTAPDFLIHTGDLINSESDRAWETFFNLEAGLLRQCPVYPVRGNSDGGSEGFREKFYLPDNELWYHFTYGSVFFIALDIQNEQAEEHYQKTIGPQSKQYQWLVRQLQSRQRQQSVFTVVYFHAPMFPPDGKEDPYLAETLCPLFKAAGVDLVLNGQHYFSYAQKGGVTYIISGGGGAALNSQARIKSEHVRVYHPVFHHLRVQVNEPAMIIEAVDNAGTVFYTHSLISRETGGGELHAAASLPGAESVIPVDIYGTVDCRECEKVKKKILPKAMKRFSKQQFAVRFLDVEKQEHYETYMRLESKYGKQGPFPVVALPNGLLSGEQLSAETLSVRFSALAGRNVADIAKGFFIWSYLILFSVILFVIIFLHLYRRKNEK